MARHRYVVIAWLGIIACIWSGGCASSTQQAASSPPASMDAMKLNIATALRQGEPATARETIAAALRAQPNNGYFHLLNGLTYQYEDSSIQSLAMAKVGYDAAVKLAPGNYWSHYLAGAAAFQQQEYSEAAEHFSRAILDDPTRPRGFLGLAAAAYSTGDLDIANLAAEHALTLAPQDPLALRSVAFVAAARGDKQRLQQILDQSNSNLDASSDRLSQLLRTSVLNVRTNPTDQDSPENPAIQDPPNPSDSQPQPVNHDANQVMVEVTLLLNQAAIGKSTGINLLDGLRIQFGLEHMTEQRIVSATPHSSTQVFTTALKIPEINYSLNLFNTKQDFYRVVARPSLVASLGEQSEFFIGRNITVGVSGLNTGSIQPIDVGTSVKLRPIEITPTYGKFRVEIVRSFFAQEAGGTFTQSLTAFKQTVAATAEVDFGKTMILSALYEGVEVSATSKTPVLGDIPIVDTFFNARTQTERQDVALVLVTPRLAGTIETNSREFRGETLQNLLSLWHDLVDPRANTNEIIKTLKNHWRPSRFFGAKPGDLHVPSVSDGSTRETIVQETMAQLP